VVFHVDLLSHFPDPVQALTAMSMRLRRGGHLCFEVGLLGGVSPWWYRIAGGIEAQHRWLFSETALRGVLERAGLEVVAIRRFGLIPSFLPICLRRFFLSRIGRPLSPQPGQRRDFDERSVRHRILGWLLVLLRYRLGRWVPRVGPLTLFVAARPTTNDNTDDEPCISQE
jgi:hypothetical protein